MPGVSSTGGGPRNRAYFGAKRASGGGAGPTLTARLDIGPDFGETAGNDDNTFTSSASIPPIDRVDLVGNFDDAGQVSLDALALAGDLNDNSVIDFQQLGLDGALSSAGTIDVFDLLADYNLHSSSGTLFFDQLDFAGDLIDSNVLDLVDLSLEGDLESRNTLVGQANVSNTLYTPVAMNLREDSPDSQNIALYGSTIFGGTHPFLIRPETIATVTNDERVAYFKWNLTNFDGDFNSYVIDVFFEVTNPSLAQSAGINYTFRSQPSQPFSSSPYSWNNYEPITSGTLELSQTITLPANTTATHQLTILGGTSAQSDWLYCKVTSNLVGTQIQIRTRDVDNDPRTTPHEAPYLNQEIEFN